MSLEQVIAANTEALINLTEILIKQSLAAQNEIRIGPGELEPPTAKKLKDIPTSKTAPIAYKAVRELVLKLAETHLDDIKEINKNHGIKKLSEILKDPDDINSSVLDQEKLEEIHNDLLALQA
jgi:hypothetical protein